MVRFYHHGWRDLAINVFDLTIATIIAIINVIDITCRLTRDRSARDARQCPVSDVLSVSSRFTTSLLSPNFCQSLSRETGMLMLIIMLMLTVMMKPGPDVLGAVRKT